MESQTITLTAESGWHDLQWDAESECGSLLDSMESDTISEEESNGGEYIGGSTSGFDVTYDESSEQYKCAGERTLNFAYDEDSSLRKSMVDAETIDFEVYEKRMSELLADPPPVDIAEEIRKRLNGKVPASQTIKIPGIPPRIPRPFPIRGNHIKIVVPLTSINFQNLEVISSDLVLSTDVSTINIPLSESILHIPYRNCSSQRQTVKRDIEFKISKGWKVEFSKKVVSSTTISGKLKFGSYGEASVERKLTTEISNSRSMSETRDEIVRTSLNFTVQENTILDIKVAVRSFEARRSFEGPITIDGTVNLIYGKGEKKLIHKISEFLNEEERTFIISGFYANIDYEELPIQLNETPCT